MVTLWETDEETEQDLQIKIHDLLFRLGVTANYKGFYQMAYALRLCVEDQERLLLVTKWIYPDVAHHYRTNWRAVERNLRTVNRIIWSKNRGLLEELAGQHFERRPRIAQLLAVTTYILKHSGK